MHSQPTDSLAAHAAAPQAEPTGQAAQAHPAAATSLTPAQVLSWLPKDATPAQQDSAIQAHFKPKPIHWSQQPDTLHLPGHDKGRSLRDVELPIYYRESYFDGKPCFHAELFGGRPGVAGDPVPYHLAGDNLITSLLLACFILMAVAFTHSRHFILRQAKTFFRVQRENTTTITETSEELRFQLFLTVQTCLLLALAYFFYTQRFVTDTFSTDHYRVIALYTGTIGACALLKAALYWLTGSVFFDGKSVERWMKSYLFLFSVEGVALFPLVLLQTYFRLPPEFVFIGIPIVVVLFKMLTFHKLYLVFFRQEGLFFHIFLYFCALEIVPTAALWGLLALINSYLEINF